MLMPIEQLPVDYRSTIFPDCEKDQLPNTGEIWGEKGEIRRKDYAKKSVASFPGHQVIGKIVSSQRKSWNAFNQSQYQVFTEVLTVKR